MLLILYDIYRDQKNNKDHLYSLITSDTIVAQICRLKRTRLHILSILIHKAMQDSTHAASSMCLLYTSWTVDIVAAGPEILHSVTAAVLIVNE